MNTEFVSIFSSAGSEQLALCSGAIDLTDFPVTTNPCLCPTGPCPNIAVTAPVTSQYEFEIQFNMANQFWGIPLQFGNSLKGNHIRQAIDHLVDRAAFVADDPNLGGKAMAIDNPVPPSDGLITPNSCGWDLFPNATETGASCVVGNAAGINTGGTAYHLAPACTASPCPGPTPWSPGPGSADLCIAANHFIAAGISTSHNANCQLTGTFNATALANAPTFLIRNDNYPRLDLGTSIAQEICYLLTGSISLGASGCAAGPGLNLLFAPIGTAISLVFTTPGTLATGPNLAWWMYTAGFGGVFPFDSLLYYEYNSLFVDAFGLPPGSPCKTVTGGTYASNYMYICVPQYDTWSSAMEFASCLSATGDPTAGSASNAIAGTCSGVSGTCPSTPTACSAVSAGFEAENILGAGALTLPDYSPTVKFAYLNSWSRVVDDQGVGLPNYFTWLNAYRPSPAVLGTIRQGFDQPTASLNPYTAYAVNAFYILNNIYDTLYKTNPLDPSQVLDWMTTKDQVLSNAQLGYSPPASTVASIRNTLRNDMLWQDGAQVTAWDVEFSLLTLGKCLGCQLGLYPNPITGVRVLNRFQFDINLNSMGPFTKLDVGSSTIIPGRHWSSCGTATWDADVAAGSVPSSCMSLPSVPPIASSAFDPLAAGILIGSGPWACDNTGSNTGVAIGTVGTGCSSTNTQNPPAGGNFTFTRYSGYFRSSSSLALWIWTGNTGSFTSDFVNFSAVAFCYGKPLGTTGCTHWQQGIGAPGGSSIVGIVQLSEVGRFFQVNWTAPYSWTQLAGIGTGPGVSFDGVPAPVLYGGSAVLNPASVVGCGAPYPTGGYDC